MLGQKGAGGTREWLSQQNQPELSAGPQKGRPVTSGGMLRVAVSTPPSIWGPHVGSEMCQPTLGGLASTSTGWGWPLPGYTEAELSRWELPGV